MFRYCYQLTKKADTVILSPSASSGQALSKDRDFYRLVSIRTKSRIGVRDDSFLLISQPRGNLTKIKE